MPRTLIVPGVSVTTKFEVAPPLPARSGILGAVGIVDDATVGVTGVTSRQELLELFGPATQFSFPEALSALANGVSEVIVSPVSGGGRAAVNLMDSDAQPVVRLIARASGPWGNNVRVRVTRRFASDGRTVRNVTVDVLIDGRVVESHEGLILSAGHDQDIFTAINRDSRVLVAIDPEYGLELPLPNAGRVAFEDSTAAAAGGTLRRNGAALITLGARGAGRAGNNISVSVTPGRATATLVDGTGVTAARVRSANPARPTDPALAVSVASAPTGVNVQVLTNGAPTATFNGVADVAALETALESAGLLVDRTGDNLPAPTAGPVALAATRTVSVLNEGVSGSVYEDTSSADGIVAALNTDANVSAALALGATGTQLPDVTAPTDNAYLSGGRDAGLARSYPGQTNPEAVLELVPAPDSEGAQTRFRVTAGTAPSTVRVEAGVGEGNAFELREAFDELTMDPDSPRYLPDVLEAESSLLRAIDRYPRSGISTFPVETSGSTALFGGTMPPLSAFEAAIDGLALEDSVDIMLAGLQRWADTNLAGIEVQQAMLGHALAQSDSAKPRIVLGSIPPALNNDVAGILDHANQVRNRRFVLAAPSGVEGAVAGLLGHLEFYQSPTFKTIASPGVDLVRYRESELNQMLGPLGNVLVVTSRRGKGVIAVRGLTTDGSQISVIRVADRAVREVKAISDMFIGELNNADTRNALKQMIFARFAQLEKDGAIVPSVDGSSPAFQVEVYASQIDAAGGIVRIDIAVRPVREIAFIYATITVQL